MSNYLVLTYDKKDKYFKEPINIQHFPYSDKEEVINYIYYLKADTPYRIYKEIVFEIKEEEV